MTRIKIKRVKKINFLDKSHRKCYYWKGKSFVSTSDLSTSFLCFHHEDFACIDKLGIYIFRLWYHSVSIYTRNNIRPSIHNFRLAQISQICKKKINCSPLRYSQKYLYVNMNIQFQTVGSVSHKVKECNIWSWWSCWEDDLVCILTTAQGSAILKPTGLSFWRTCGHNLPA